MEVGNAKKVLVERRLLGEEQKEAAGSNRSRSREQGPGRKRAAEESGGKAEVSRRKL